MAEKYYVDVNVDSGEAAESYDLNMFAGYSASRSSGGDLFDLVWKGGRPLDRDHHNGMEAYPPPAAASSSCLPSLTTTEMKLPEPPSEDEMAAAWLHQIVRGEELAAGAQPPAGGSNVGVGAVHVAVDGRQVPVKDDFAERWPAGNQSMEINTRKLPTDDQEGTYTCTGTRCESNSERKKTSRARRSSQYSETHSLTEKRRRCKINQKLKTLQQLVPGCDKSNNQASTLDQTIQYMKSLQQHVQAMSVGCSTIDAGGAPAGMVLPWSPPMVPFPAPAVLPLVHHPAAVMMMVAAPPPIYPAAAGALPVVGSRQDQAAAAGRLK
ncbi:hypothetical protein ABZP36_033963 [Zizania latifolia]